MFFYVYSGLIITTILMSLANKWLLAKGSLKPVYWIEIVLSITYIATNCLATIWQSELAALLLYIPLNLWTMAMAVKGLRRMKCEALSNSIK